MNDNRTTELREKLDELSIEHFNYDKGGRTQTQWEAPDGKRHFTYETSDNPAKTARLVIAWHPTPEQAIAATLGSERIAELEAENERLRKAGYEIGYHDAMKSAKHGGTLTAEQVRETVEKHWHDLPADYDMPEATALPEYSYDWQAITDELNAELGSGTCELTETDSYSNANEVVHVLECSACGETCEHVNGSYPRCPNCGRKAVER